MLDIDFIRKNPKKVQQGAKNKGVEIDITRLITLDDTRRQLKNKLDNLRHQQNQITEKLQGNTISKLTDTDKKQLQEQAKELKKQVKTAEAEYKQVFTSWQQLMLKLPNLPEEGVPIGGESANQVLRKKGPKPKFNFPARDYLTLAEKLGWIDIKRAAKISGTRFGILKNQAALLELALVQLSFDYLVNKYQFIPVIPPVLIREPMMRGMGYIDTKADRSDRYFLPKDKLYLVGTSEQAVGPMHAGEILAEKDLPLRYVAFSTCFRREAGAHGKDTKGILRVHQFDKVEMFIFCQPESSKKEHKLLVQIQEELMQKLGLPYRVVQLASGDLARPSATTIDIETWLPGQNNGQGTYRETHSASNTTDFQARRLNIRYRPTTPGQQPTTQFVHMLNATAFALGRMLIAIIENYQQEDSTIKIPNALKPYMP